MLRAHGGTALPRQIAFTAPGSKRKTWDLANQEQSNARFCLRFKYPEPRTAEKIAPDEFQAKADEVAERWEKRLAPAKRFEVPETRVMEAYRAWLTYSMLNADSINGYIEPHDGAGFYEEMFGFIRKSFPTIHLHALSAPEVYFLQKLTKQPMRDVMSSSQ